ncbi:hypothetical protein FGO68_gene17775 [Halteria grandinella]|uniref:Uncharacterized protein n=1 Tax=Halteria grandinella TaxID=5974 RepID=A0A8J8P2E2_HALGN|nr:hypothetical protein FGO68_gene17775 [Halteria grandinella]
MECSKLGMKNTNLNEEISRNSSEGSSENRDSKNYALNEEDDILQEREDDGMRIQGGVYYSQSKRDLNSCEDEEEERDSEYDDGK